MERQNREERALHQRELTCVDGPHMGHKAFLSDDDQSIHLMDGSVYRRHRDSLRWDQTESEIQRRNYNAFLATRATKKRKIR